MHHRLCCYNTPRIPETSAMQCNKTLTVVADLIIISAGKALLRMLLICYVQMITIIRNIPKNECTIDPILFVKRFNTITVTSAAMLNTCFCVCEIITSRGHIENRLVDNETRCHTA